MGSERPWSPGNERVGGGGLGEGCLKIIVTHMIDRLCRNMCCDIKVEVRPQCAHDAASGVWGLVAVGTCTDCLQWRMVL